MCDFKLRKYALKIIKILLIYLQCTDHSSEVRAFSLQ